MSETVAALKRGIKHYRDGLGDLADDLHCNAEVLRKELGADPGHKLGAVRAVHIARLLAERGGKHCHDFAAHVAEECGGRFEPLASGGAVDLVGAGPVQRIAPLMLEVTDITNQVLDAMADGAVSDNELAAIEREIAEAEEVLRKLRQAARAVHAAGKPHALRAAA